MGKFYGIWIVVRMGLLDCDVWLGEGGGYGKFWGLG